MATTFEDQINNSQSFIELYQNLTSHQKLQMNIEWHGFEIIVLNGKYIEDFEIDVLSHKIQQLLDKINLSGEEIAKGKEVCRITEKLYAELEDQYLKLGCLLGLSYRLYHYKRKTDHPYSCLWKKHFQDIKMVYQNSWPIFLALAKFEDLERSKKMK